MSKRKGIILAGGSGTRLYPLTLAVSKQLMPVYDKPMIYYPLSVLMLAGIRDILIISTPHDLPHFQKLLGDGTQWGLSFSYEEQPSPDGLAQAFHIGETFLDGAPAALVLGDNLFYGHEFAHTMEHAADNMDSATIFGYHVANPSDYGVVEFDAERRAISLEEKPEQPKSSYAVPGIYFYPSDVCDLARDLKPSPRGELEITDAIQWLLTNGHTVHPYVHTGWWIDTGKPLDMLSANDHVLDEMVHEVSESSHVDSVSEVGRRVTLQTGVRIINSIIRGPSIIGGNSVIENAYVGPYTSIYHDCILKNCEIELLRI